MRRFAKLWLVAVLFCGMCLTVAAREVELRDGTTEILNVPGVERVVVHDASVVEAETTGRPGEVLITARGFGKGQLTCYDQDGQTTRITVTVQPRYWATLEEMLIDYPQIRVVNTGEHLLLQGTVMRGGDLQRINEIAALDPERIRNRVRVSTVGVDENILQMLERQGFEDIQVQVIGGVVYLSGMMFDKQRNEELISRVNAFIKEYGLELNNDGLIVQEANLTIDVQFLRVDTGRARDLGLEVGNIQLGAEGGAGFETGVSPRFTGTVSGNVDAVVRTLMANNAASSEYQTSFSTKSGERARIQEGGSIFKEVSGVETGDVVEIDYGFIVVTTPKLLDKETIECDIDLRVSAPVQTEGDIHLTQFQTESTYTLTPGDTIILSGLNHNVEGSRRTGVPVLSSIPLVGAIFTSSSKDKREAEILLLITVNWDEQEDVMQRYEELRGRDVDVPIPGTPLPGR